MLAWRLICKRTGDILKPLQRSLVLLFALVVPGCSKKGTAVQRTGPTAPISSNQKASDSSPKTSTPVASPNVGVSDELARQCAVRVGSREDAPRFAFDDADLLPEDRNVLEQVAQCLTRGPLRGKQLQLIGRADPRGTDEYNLALGTRRAESVSSYLQRLGVPGTQLSRTTRGDIDAVGMDERGWRGDRRVDLELR
jgi:peptidoglycan-associated lipoprotein